MSSLPLILSIETATLAGSVCLRYPEQIIGVRVGNTQVSHSNNLLSDIKSIFDETDFTVRDVGLFAAASGPGSFTGLRIGLATIKALAATLDRPCVGVPTLKAIAHAAGESESTVALLPAGRGELFAQRFSVSGELVTELDQPAHLTPPAVLGKYKHHKNLLWSGTGVESQLSLIHEEAQRSGLTWNCAPAESNLSISVGALAWQLFASGNPENAYSVSAIYVRPSDAELKQQCR